MTRKLSIRDARNGLDVHATLVDGKAPANAAFLWAWVEVPRIVPSIHAIWTGPEISCPVPLAQIEGQTWATALPPENATLHPQPGDVVLAYVPPRMWGGNPDPIFDVGLFYGPGARMFFPIGWLAGSVAAQVLPEERAALAEACNRIRKSGATEITFARVE